MTVRSFLLENTRYRAEETKNGEAFSKDLASLCDVFVNDAFGTAHRAHCSNVGVTQFVDTAVVGYLMQKEIDFLGNAVNNPERPFVAILGGAKVSSKISVIENLLDKVDTLIIGGGMSYTFSKALGGSVGVSLLEEDYCQYALDMLKKAEEKGVKLLLPVDNVIADDFSNDANTKVVKRGRDSGWLGRSGYRTGNSRDFLKSCKRSENSCMERTDGCIRDAEASQQVQRQLQKHWLRQMLLRSSEAEIPQQQ